jgi:hypothetical protein
MTTFVPTANCHCHCHFLFENVRFHVILTINTLFFMRFYAKTCVSCGHFDTQNPSPNTPKWPKNDTFCATCHRCRVCLFRAVAVAVPVEEREALLTVRVAVAGWQWQWQWRGGSGVRMSQKWAETVGY